MLVDETIIVGSAVLITFLTVWQILRYKRKTYTNLILAGCILFSASSVAVCWWPNKQDLTAIFGSNNLTTTVAFSPKQGASILVIKTIQSAKKNIYVAAYYFTSKPIADALMQAHDRGVNIKIVLDRTQRKARGSLFEDFRLKGIPTRINSKYRIMHNKFMIIDDITLQVGSFNYTDSAEYSNAENVLVIRNDVELVASYLEQWKKLWLESQE